MGLVKKTDHIAIIAKDLDESTRFYTEILGYEIFERGELENGNLKNVRLRAPGDAFIIELLQFTDGRAYHDGDGLIEVVAMRVDDIFAAIEILKGKGVVFLQPKPVQVGPRDFFIFFRGPSGERLEIIQQSEPPA
ncbi:MAG: VOC family protein [Clostridiales Family XIII bacterium]|nr:VOC family protein [Clostridiales Family XIII bacterium]